MTPTQVQPAQVPTALQVQMVGIDQVKPLRRNPRRGDVERVRRSIRRWGQYVPIVVRAETREIVKGNHTHAALLEEGETHIAIVERAIATDAEAEALAIADNVASDAATWDVGMLAEILSGGEIEIDATLLTEVEIERITVQADLEAALEAGRRLDDDTDEPPVPDPPAKPVTRAGDVWEIGPHRLVCGDSTDPATVALAAPDGLDLLMTSPPYNVGVKYYGKAADDRMRGWEKYGGFLRRTLEAWLPAMRDGRAVAWNIGVAPETFPAHQHLLLEELGLTFVRQIVWDKKLPGVPQWHHVEKQPVARNYPVEYRHELVLVFATAGGLQKGDRLPVLDPMARQSVISLSPINARKDVPAGEHAAGAAAGSMDPSRREHLAKQGRGLDRHKAKQRPHAAGSVNAGLKRNYEKAHPAVYPIKLPRPFIGHLTAPGEIVGDPFGGAATTLLAAHRLDRRAALVEIDEGFCDVAIQRVEEATGLKAKRQRRRRAKKETKP